MRPVLLVVVAVLLVSSMLPLTGVVVAPDSGSAGEHIGAPSPSAPVGSGVVAQATSDGTTSRLGVGGESVSAYREPTPDLATTLAADDDELHREWQFHELEYEWSSLSPSEREERLLAYERGMRERLAEFDERERQAVTAMSNGEGSPDRILSLLARTDHEADVLHHNLDRLTAFANDVSGFTFSTRTTAGGITTHEGPVRDRLYQQFSASSPTESSTRTLIEAADSGLVLSTTTGGSYLREATRYEYRDTDATSQIDDIDGAFERLRQRYPWALSTQFENGKSLDQSPLLNQFNLEATHPQGFLRAHLDSGTEEVFRETQELTIGRLPTETVESWTGSSTRVALNTTAGHGPVELTVTRTESDTPVPATIVSDGTTIARTGSDGSVWLVRPVTGTELTVQSDAESVPITLPE